MKIAAVLTDLDGTVLEPDGSLRPEARATLGELVALGIPVCAVTSKTVAELLALLADLGLTSPAGFENGAGVCDANGTVELSPSALPVAELRKVLAGLRARTGVTMRSVEELDNEELTAITGLSGTALTRLRRRHATLPLVVDPGQDPALRGALPTQPSVRLIRGNRFLHLQGDHDKADVAARLLELVGQRPGRILALGDSPNDGELLARASLPVIVPGETGPCPYLVHRFPDARIAPAPHGRGWGAAVTSLLRETA